MTLLQEKKSKKILTLFDCCDTPKDVYKKIISLGKTLKPFDPKQKNEKNRVYGCQSLMYLYAKKTSSNTIQFFSTSDALISKGLAALMLELYNFETVENILTISPNLLDKIRLFESLSPTRINGLKAFYLKLVSIAQQLAT